MRNKLIRNFIFIGGTYRGFKVLDSLLKSGYIPAKCFVLKEDRHEILKYSPQIIDLAVKNKLRYALRKRLSAPDYDYIKKNDFEFGIVCGWRSIIDPAILNHFKFGLVAAHDSLLPKYRGFAPMNWAIINGEKEAGVTLFLVKKGEIDSGDIISQKKVLIDNNDYAIDVCEKITEATVYLILNFLHDYKKDMGVFKKQNEKDATYTCKRIPEDGRIDWQKTSKDIFNLIRALAYPYPGAFCFYNGKIYYIRKAELSSSNKKYEGRIFGRVIKIHNRGIEVLCGSGSIVITEWEDKSKGVIECPSKVIKSITATLE